MAALVLSVPPTAGAPLAAPFRVTLGYTPSLSDPLLVTFVATVIPGTPTAFNWTFGDGVQYNGSGANAGVVAHHYPPAGGTFTVTVLAHEGASSNVTSLTITVAPGTLSVGLTALPLSGPAPLTVTFQALVTGGTGTYRSLTWSFGTGQSGSGSIVLFTYTAPGRYSVSVNATDTSGNSVLATTNITVLTGGDTGPSAGTIDLRDALFVAGGAAAGALVGVVALLGWQRRARRRTVPEEAAPVAATPGPGSPAPEGRPAPAAPSAPPAGLSGPSGAPGPAPELPEAPVAVPAPTPAPAASPRPAAEALRISQRVVLHLSLQGVLGPHEVASIGFTQPGISQALGIRQNALTNVLRRLVAADVIVEDVRHVQGQPRRLKVYQLTPRGEALARELRHPRPAGTRPPSAPSSPPGADDPT